MALARQNIFSKKVQLLSQVPWPTLQCDFQVSRGTGLQLLGTRAWECKPCTLKLWCISSFESCDPCFNCNHWQPPPPSLPKVIPVKCCYICISMNLCHQCASLGSNTLSMLPPWGSLTLTNQMKFNSKTFPKYLMKGTASFRHWGTMVLVKCTIPNKFLLV